MFGVPADRDIGRAVRVPRALQAISETERA
jgi:hypothetical protein